MFQPKEPASETTNKLPTDTKVKERGTSPDEHSEDVLAKEQRAMKQLIERREKEEMIAQLSRERMNSLLSVGEIAEVS